MRPRGSKMWRDSVGGGNLKIFISHSSQDAEVARALVELFEKALKLSASDIRCTSVNGYRLPAGANTDSQLRQEIFNSDVLIGVITPSSSTSIYVLFELGARWGAGRYLVPVLACGAGADLLSGPLSAINTLNLSDSSHVMQLIEDIARQLSIAVEPMASFQRAVQSVVGESSKLSPQRPPTSAASSAVEPSAEEIRVLQHLAGIPDDDTAENIAKQLGVTEQRAKFHLLELGAKKLAWVNPVVYGITTYSITQEGRKQLVARGLL